MAKRALHWMCHTNNRCHVFTFVFMAFVIMYAGLSFLDFSPYTGYNFWKSVPPCYDPIKLRTPLLDLAFKMHSILNSMEIEDWLMYGSLWGPLCGIPGPLPWDYNVDIGISGDGNFSKVPFDEFKARFTAAGLKVKDRSRRSGNVLLAEENGEEGELLIYYNHGGVMTLAGYETWIVYINYRLFYSLPSVLV